MRSNFCVHYQIFIFFNFFVFFRIFCIFLLKFVKEHCFLLFLYYISAKFHQKYFSYALSFLVKNVLLILWHTVLSTAGLRCLEIMCLCFPIACTLVLYMPHFLSEFAAFFWANLHFFQNFPHFFKVSCGIFLRSLPIAMSLLCKSPCWVRAVLWAAALCSRLKASISGSRDPASLTLTHWAHRCLHW